MNNKQEFRNFLKNYGFTNSEVLSTFNLYPRCLKDDQGNRHIVGNIHVCIFGGKGTSETDLGCVTFSYQSKTRLKGRKTSIDQSELFKKAFVAKDANHAIKEFKEWHEATKKELNQWKQII